jgi:hypothetical protein
MTYIAYVITLIFCIYRDGEFDVAVQVKIARLSVCLPLLRSDA